MIEKIVVSGSRNGSRRRTPVVSVVIAVRRGADERSSDDKRLRGRWRNRTAAWKREGTTPVLMNVVPRQQLSSDDDCRRQLNSTVTCLGPRAVIELISRHSSPGHNPFGVPTRAGRASERQNRRSKPHCRIFVTNVPCVPGRLQPRQILTFVRCVMPHKCTPSPYPPTPLQFPAPSHRYRNERHQLEIPSAASRKHNYFTYCQSYANVPDPNAYRIIQPKTMCIVLGRYNNTVFLCADA
jgi:hypothetical protein